MPCMPYRPETKGKTETQNKIIDQLKNYNGHYSGLPDIHDKLEKINSEDNERPSQATRLPRNFLLEKEKGDLLPLPSKEIRSKYHLKLNEVYVTKNRYSNINTINIPYHKNIWKTCWISGSKQRTSRIL